MFRDKNETTTEMDHHLTFPVYTRKKIERVVEYYVPDKIRNSGKHLLNSFYTLLKVHIDVTCIH